MTLFRAIAGALVLVASTVSALAGSAGGASVDKAWARATPKGAAIGAVYGEIHTPAGIADKLISVATPAAGTAEIHTHSEVDGVMKMRRLDALDIPAGETRKLAPGGLHIMLFDLKGPLEEGRSFPITFTFEKAGAVTVDATVAAVGSMGPAAKDGASDNGSHENHGGQ